VQTKDRDIIEKNLTSAQPYVGQARGEISIENPVITIISSVSLINFNYCFIEEFNRYYFIDSKKLVRNNVWEFTLSEDYLYTWRNMIYTWTVELERAQYDWNLYFKDGEMMCIEGHNLNVLEFPNSLPTTKHNILIINGGR
jgi:hypothetical protein